MSDLVIVDAEYVFAEQILDTYLDQLIEAAGTFEGLCAKVREWAIKDSEICGVLVELENDMRVARLALTQLRSSLSGRATGFVGRINELDQFLY